MGIERAPLKKCAVYIRVSTDRQEALNQIIALRPFCASRNYTIFNEYIDICSGSKDARPQFDLMFQHARQHYFDVVVFWALDRFSRSGTLYTLQKLRELENLKIEWASFQETYLDSAGQFKDVVISIMATLSKIEKERISERTKAGLKTAINVGKRGKDKKPRKYRKDKGIKRAIPKTPEMVYQNKVDQLT